MSKEIVEEWTHNLVTRVLKVSIMISDSMDKLYPKDGNGGVTDVELILFDKMEKVRKVAL